MSATNSIATTVLISVGVAAGSVFAFGSAPLWVPLAAGTAIAAKLYFHYGTAIEEGITNYDAYRRKWPERTQLSRMEEVEGFGFSIETYLKPFPTELGELKEKIESAQFLRTCSGVFTCVLLAGTLGAPALVNYVKQSYKDAAQHPAQKLATISNQGQTLANIKMAYPSEMPLRTTWPVKAPNGREYNLVCGG